MRTLLWRSPAWFLCRPRGPWGGLTDWTSTLSECTSFLLSSPCVSFMVLDIDRWRGLCLSEPFCWICNFVVELEVSSLTGSHFARVSLYVEVICLVSLCSSWSLKWVYWVFATLSEYCFVRSAVSFLWLLRGPLDEFTDWHARCPSEPFCWSHLLLFTCLQQLSLSELWVHHVSLSSCVWWVQRLTTTSSKWTVFVGFILYLFRALCGKFRDWHPHCLSELFFVEFTMYFFCGFCGQMTDWQLRRPSEPFVEFICSFTCPCGASVCIKQHAMS